MDFHQTTERYRKREARSQITVLLWLLVAAVTLCLGWFVGTNQNWSYFSPTNEQLVELRQVNNRLEQQQVAAQEDLTLERQKRIAAELLANDDDVELRSLRRMMVNYLAKGISVDQIRMALLSVGNPAKCRKLEQRDVAVATPQFAGGETKRLFISETMGIFIEGEAGKDSTREKPWFDAQKPVSIRISYLGGEKTSGGILPHSMTLIADGWLIRIRLTETSLRGYANVTISKCLIE